MANYKTLAASGQVKATDGELVGILVSTSTALTLKVWDSLSATGTAIVETTGTLSAGAYIPMPANFGTGCYVTIGGTGTITVFYK
jgi:hypothetical protein